jgi:hypothetical protein
VEFNTLRQDRIRYCNVRSGISGLVCSNAVGSDWVWYDNDRSGHVWNLRLCPVG